MSGFLTEPHTISETKQQGRSDQIDAEAKMLEMLNGMRQQARERTAELNRSVRQKQRSPLIAKPPSMEGKGRTGPRPVWFKGEELMALALAAQSAQAVLAPTAFYKPLRSAFDRLLEDWAPGTFFFEPEQEPHRRPFGQARSLPVPVDLNPIVLRRVLHAIRKRRSLRIRYEDEVSSTGEVSASHRRIDALRTVDPLVVGVKEGQWMLAAYSHRQGAMVNFALSGIRRAHPCEEGGEGATFDWPEDFDPDLHFGYRAAQDEEALQEVRLLVDPEAAPLFQKTTYHPSQQVDVIDEDAADDGSPLVVTYRVRDLEAIESFVASWGAQVKVLAPEALADRVAESARQAAARYE